MSNNYLPYISDSESEDTSYYSSDEESVKPPPLAKLQSDDLSYVGNPGPTDTIKILSDVKPKFTPSQNTTLVMISSRDRDTRLYPQPTYFTIRLPKTYKNIKSINITQLNLLNSFFNFTEAKGNTFMYIRELGRTRRDANGNIIPNDIRVQLRTGTYTTTSLVTELNNALNKTPLFSDISGGLGSFISQFQGTGDYSILFNQPGPVVFNTLTQAYESNITMSQLVARYFQNVQTVGTINFNYNQCLVAYYYPVIKEMTASNIAFNQHPEALPAGFTVPSDYILFAFEGLSDAYILTLIQDPANIVLFDNYRAANTFQSFLVNKYTCTYNANQGRLQILAPSLNDSIQTDINLKYTQFLTEEVLAAGFPSVAVFNSNYNALTNQNGSLLEFYNFIHTRFTNQFGINFGTYTVEFFANLSNEIQIYNTVDGRGWSPILLPSVSSNAISESATVDAQISTPLKNVIIQFTDPYQSLFYQTSNLSVIQSFSNASETTYGYRDLRFNMLPTGYVGIYFRSRCRQSISIMTLPRYLTERIPSTEERYNLGPDISQTPLLFEITTSPPYSTVYIKTDISGATDFNMYTFNQLNLYNAYSYFRTNDTWVSFMTPQILNGIRIQDDSPSYNVNPPVSDITLFSYRPHIFFQMHSDGYAINSAAFFKIKIVVETRDGSTFAAPIRVSWYRDRAAFMMDATQILLRNYTPNDRNVFVSQVFSGTSSAELVVQSLNQKDTYIAVHIADPNNVPGSVPLRVYAMLQNPYGVYDIATQLDYRDMPYKGIPVLTDQTTPASAIYDSPIKSIYDNSITQIGYDISGVSNNLLDYYIQSSDETYYDPSNIKAFQTDSKDGLQYSFFYETPGSAPPAPDTSNWSLYFNQASKNAIIDFYNTDNTLYLDSSIALKAPMGRNETLLVNWFQAGALPNVVEEYLNPAPNGSTSITDRIALSSPGIFQACFADVGYLTDVSTSVGFQDISGFVGMSFFLKPNDITRIMNVQLKFAYIQPSFDPANVPITRANSPLGLTDTQQYRFRNQATYTNTSCNAYATWDDWYLNNRSNVRIGIFKTGDISGANVANLQLASSIMTMTLSKITQVGNYTNSAASTRTREPDWGTYYSYEVISTPQTIWAPQSSSWVSTIVSADQTPTYVAGETSYPGYFLSHTNINNYSFLPRSIGIAPSVGYAMEYPYALTSSYTSDIPNSYTIVPFVQDGSNWRVGSFYGAAFTRNPGIPDPTKAGAAPYYGPAGPFAWTRNVSTIVLAKGAETTQKPYYWNGKIALDTLNQDYNPATDLTFFGGFAGISNEFQDTRLFFYKNEDLFILDDVNDMLTLNADGFYAWIWGNESNSRYIRQDDQSGYNYLSYLHDLTVRSTNATVGQYAIHVRGYVPTAFFRTGVRIIGKNYTDFGTATLDEISSEIVDLSGYQPISDISGYEYSLGNLSSYSTVINTNDSIRLGNGKFYSHQYADALINFDNQFYYSSITFGKKIGYSGRTFTLAGYSNTMTQYVNYYSTLRGSQAIYTDVLSTSTGRLNDYVADRYGSVLPANVLNRNRITDPLPFSMLFSTYTIEPYSSRYDEWGLGWNLGYPRIDTPYLINQVSSTFIRILEDFIYLRLNPEMNLNTMGVSTKEDLSLTRDTFAEERKYFAKILLNNFGGFCRAAVQMPKDFNPYLGKYELLSLQLVDRNGVQISNVDCEYDIVMQITEVVDGAVNSYTIPLGY